MRAAIEQPGYRPFSVARSLRTRQTRTITLVVPDIANPSFSTIASAAEDFAHSRGYTLALYNTHDDMQRETSYIETASLPDDISVMGLDDIELAAYQSPQLTTIRQNFSELIVRQSTAQVALSRLTG